MHENRRGFGILLPAVLVSFLIPLGAQSAEVTLAWDLPEDDRVVGIRIYYGEADTDFTSAPQITIYGIDQTRVRIGDLEEAVLYAFAATSFDAFERESEFSEILLYRIPEAGQPNDGDPVADDEEWFEDEDDSGGGGGGCFIGHLM